MNLWKFNIKIASLLLIIIILLIVILPKSDTKNALVIIAHDYSTIQYDGQVFVPINPEMLPNNLDFDASRGFIRATVEGENYWLDKFLTNYIFVADYEGYKFIYLITDYDVNESDYYCPKIYLDSLSKEKN